MKPLLISIFSILLILSCSKNNDIDTSPVTPPPTPRTPVVATNPISNHTFFEVTLNGKIVDTGSAKVTEQGIVMDTLPMPTIYKNFKHLMAQVDSSGAFNVRINNLPTNKNWYVRAYAINSKGIAYGEEVKFASFTEKVYSGDVTLNSQNAVNTFGAKNYTTIDGTVTISGDVTDLTPLKSLVVINEDLIVRNTQLTNFNGLENLDIIQGFDVRYNQALINFSGLKKLRIVNGNFFIVNNDALVNLVGLDNLIFSGSFAFWIEGCPNLTSIDGVEKMKAVLGSITLKNNPKLNNLRAWSNLAAVSESISIINSPSLQNLDGLEGIKKLEGIQLTNNPMLADIKALRNIEAITGTIEIDNNDALTDLSPFTVITTTTYVSIKNNDAILNLESFKNLQKVDYLTIENNSALTSLQGLRRLKSTKRLEIYQSSSLKNLNGLDSLNAITGDGWSISIWSNKQLESLDGLQKLTAVNGISISSNPKLVNYCALKPVLAKGFINNFHTEFNGNNPTQAQIMSSCP